MDIIERTISESKETIEGVTFGFNAEKSCINVDGRVWIGDPCYPPFFNEYWNEGWLAAFWKCQKVLRDKEASDDSVVVTVNGIEMVAGSTAYGDGSYPLSGADGVCLVDAGLLCVIPEAMFELAGLDGVENEGGVYVDNVKGTAEIDDEGNLRAGHVSVITQERCENCNAIEGECFCEKCWECGEWEDYCRCCPDCECMYCECDDEDDEYDEDYDE